MFFFFNFFLFLLLSGLFFCFFLSFGFLFLFKGFLLSFFLCFLFCLFLCFFLSFLLSFLFCFFLGLLFSLSFFIFFSGGKRDLSFSLILFVFGCLVFKLFCLFSLNSLFSFHLLFNFEHLKLCFGLSSLELMLSLHSGKISFSSSFLGSGGFCLLNSLSSKEFLLLFLSFKFLFSLFLLEFFKLFSSFFCKNFLLLSFLFGICNFSLKFNILFQLSLSLFFFICKLIKESFLLGFLLSFKLLKSLILKRTSRLSSCLGQSISLRFFITC